MNNSNRVTDLIAFSTVTGIFILFVICIFFAWYFYFKAKHKERLLLIEKGIDPTPPAAENQFQSFWLKIGIVLIGFSIGLGIVGNFRMNEVVSFSILGISGGISFIIAYYISK